MKYFLDTEFIEDYYTNLRGKKRHYIDLISIGIIREDGQTLSAISKEYRYKDASDWVKKNVIKPLYTKTINGDLRHSYTEQNFNQYYGSSHEEIKELILQFFGCWRDQHFWRAPDGIEVYGYFADYDWVLFCSLFGKMIDLPKGFPMYCIDLKQMMYERGLNSEWKKAKCPDPEDAHDCVADARWNRNLYEKIKQVNILSQ